MPKRGSDELLGLLMNPYPQPTVTERAAKAARLIKPTTEQKKTYPTTKGELAYPGDSITPRTPRMVKPTAPAGGAVKPPSTPPPGVSADVKARNDKRGQQREARRQGYMK